MIEGLSPADVQLAQVTVCEREGGGGARGGAVAC